MSTSLKYQIKKLWTFFVGGGTIIAYQGWIENYKSKGKFIEQQENIQSIKKGVEDVQEKINGIVDEEMKSLLIENSRQIKENINKIQDYSNKIQNTSEKLLNKDLTTEQQNEIVDKLNGWSKDIGSFINSSITRAEELEAYLKNLGSKSNFLEDSSITKIISDYKAYVATLNVYELCILMNLLVSTFIFVCLIDILFAFYGNYLIEKLSLEKKWPRLSGIIRLRIKLQHYSIIMNSLLIVLALIFIVYVNYYTLTHPL